jgi:hypothetical protein
MFVCLVDLKKISKTNQTLKYHIFNVPKGLNPGSVAKSKLKITQH